MLGWELPPHISGGLGTACAGLLDGMSHLADVETTFILPNVLPGTQVAQGARLISAACPSPVASAYAASTLDSVHTFAGRIEHALPNSEAFDLIHAHDWLTIPAALKTKEMLGAPLILSVHSIEFDRSAHPDPIICQLEADGLTAADAVIAVSAYTKRQIIKHYGIAASKVHVVHNGVTPTPDIRRATTLEYSTVTFVGRITYQKGPEFFLDAARLVRAQRENVRFVMAGDGDLLPLMRSLARAKGLDSCIEFPGFVMAEELRTLMARSDVYVMPSVSEPFGLCAVDAMFANVPVVASRDCGFIEVVAPAVEVDYWDAQAMADGILALLASPDQTQQLVEQSRQAVEAMTWEHSARRAKAVYEAVLQEEACV